MINREDLNGILWSIADPDKPGVEKDIDEIFAEFVRLIEKINDLEFALEEERYGEDI